VLMNMILVTIVSTGLTTKKYVIVLSVLNLVSDFVKCNRPIIYDVEQKTEEKVLKKYNSSACDKENLKIN
jgi:hypothetical protein